MESFATGFRRTSSAADVRMTPVETEFDFACLCFVLDYRWPQVRARTIFAIIMNDFSLFFNGFLRVRRK